MVHLSLYMGDLTIEASGNAELVVATISGATDFVVDMLEVELLLEVSTTKSMAAAGRPALAGRIVRTSLTQKLRSVRSTKMLGTPSGGGRRRSIKALSVRLHLFSKRISRIQSLRRAGVNTSSIVRAAGTPAITYGVDA